MRHKSNVTTKEPVFGKDFTQGEKAALEMIRNSPDFQQLMKSVKRNKPKGEK